MTLLSLQRGDVVFVDMGAAPGVEKQGRHPAVVVQNDGGNRGSPLTIVALLTDARQHKGYRQQVFIAASDLGPGGKDSVVEGGHIHTIDRVRRIDAEVGVWCHLGGAIMAEVDKVLRASLEL